MVGMLLYVVGEMAVTRRFDTEFYAPVLLGVPYEVSAELVSKTGRKLEVRTELREETTEVPITKNHHFLQPITLLLANQSTIVLCEVHL